MDKKFALSNIGYAIVSVIVLGIIMIISAPMLVRDVKVEKPEEQPVQNFENSDYSEIRAVEERLTNRIEDLERRQSSAQRASDKYICSMEGKLDENGEVVPADMPGSSEKFVFVCEYR